MRNFHFPGRSPVYGRRAMCATSHPAASLTAMDVIKAGGNAVDAAIAAAAVLAVVEPAMTGIGGDCFAIIHKPGRKKLIALNASGRAPKGATPAFFASKGVKKFETTNVHSVTVPGAIDGWCTLHADYGSMSFDKLLEPAIELADKGFVVAPRVAADWANGMRKLTGAGAKQNLTKDGKAPRAGEVMRFAALAKTLKKIAKEGRAGFYEGEVARDMVKELNALGGCHTLEDFAAQRSSYVEPIAIDYKGVELNELPPSNHGIVALIMLRMLAKLGKPPANPVSAERYHLLMEVARQAFAMRDAFVADPDMAEVPVAHMLSDTVIDKLAKRIDRKKHRPELGPIPQPAGSDTVCFSIVDEKGLAVSFINSLYGDFGTGICTAKTGITLHNRGEGFVLDPKHPNCVAPGKRPMHTLVPAMATKDGKPLMAFGVMGAHFQPMGHVYVMSNMLDYGMDAQEALDTPRVFFEGDALHAEHSVPDEVVRGLEAMGHTVRRREFPWGGGQIVQFDRVNGILIGASDARKDGMALGY